MMKATNYGTTGLPKVLSTTSARWMASGEASLTTTAMTIPSARYSISLIRLTQIGAVIMRRTKRRKLRLNLNLNNLDLDLSPNNLNLSLSLPPPGLSWYEWRMSTAKRSIGYGRHEFLAAS